MSTQLRILDANLEPLAASPAFAALPGARSNVETLHIVNGTGDGLADTATELALRVMERDAGETVWLASGRPIVDGRRVEVRIVGGVGGLDVASTGWQPVGAGRDLSLPALADGQGVAVEVSLVLPLDAQGAQVELYLAVRSAATTALGGRLSETAGHGVYLGLGDGAITALLEGGDVTASDPADDSVQVAATGWLAAGNPWVIPATTVQLDAIDGDGVPLAAGSAYWALLHLTADGDLKVIRSAQGVQPLDPSLRPVVPSGSVGLAMVLRDDTGAIDGTAIERLSVPAGAALTFDNLTATLGPSQGLIDNRWWRHDAAETITFEPSQTSQLWRLSNGDLAVTTDGGRPDVRALLLYEVTTDPFGIVDVQSRLRFLDRREVVRFAFDGPLTLGATAYASWPHDHPGLLAPKRGQVVAQTVDTAGSDGATSWDIEVAAPGVPAEWVSLFASGERPSVPWDTTTRTDASAMPQVLVIPPRALLRCTVVAETTAAQPSAGVVSLTVYR